MMLKRKLDSLDGVDDAIKALYKQEGDAFILQAEGESEDVAPLKNAFERTKTELQEVRDKLATQQSEAETKQLELERQNLAEQNKQAELAESFKTELDALKSANAKAHADKIAGDVSSKAKELGNKYGSNDANKANLAALFELNMEPNEAGEPVGKGGVPLDELVSTFEKSGQYNSMWAAPGSSGAGATGGTTTPSDPQNAKAQEAKKSGDIVGFLAASLQTNTAG